jgi:hypothetical protein
MQKQPFWKHGQPFEFRGRHSAVKSSNMAVSMRMVKAPHECEYKFIDERSIFATNIRRYECACGLSYTAYQPWGCDKEEVLEPFNHPLI